MNERAVRRVLRGIRKEENRTVYRMRVQLTENIQMSAILTHRGSVNLSFEGPHYQGADASGRPHLGDCSIDRGYLFNEHVPYHAGLYLTRARVGDRRFLCLRYWDGHDWHRVIINDDDEFMFVKVPGPAQFEECFYTLSNGFAAAIGVNNGI